MNKLKGSVAAIKMKYLLFVFATVMFVALPTRVYQLLAGSRIRRKYDAPNLRAGRA